MSYNVATTLEAHHVLRPPGETRRNRVYVCAPVYDLVFRGCGIGAGLFGLSVGLWRRLEPKFGTRAVQGQGHPEAGQFYPVFFGEGLQLHLVSYEEKSNV